MKTRLCLLILLSIASKRSFGQASSLYGGGATTVSIGQITEHLYGIDGIYHNPASTAEFKKKFALDLSFENKYGLSNINVISFGALKQIGSGSFGIGLIQSGNEVLSERSFMFSYARSLFDNLKIGGRFNLHNLQIDEYGSSSLFGIDIGMLSKINKHIALSAHLHNILSTQINSEFEKPSRIAIGLSYKPSEKVALILEFEKISDRPASPKLGLIYDVNQKIQLRLGADISKTLFGFGASYKMNNINIKTAFGLHQQIGGSPAMSLQYMN